MLAAQRKALILDKLRRDGQVVAKLLSQELKLSEDTIRKDLRGLAQEGRLLRVHGGALPASPAAADYAGRQQLATAGKIAIGRAAARMIQPGQVIMLDGGTTTLQVARHMSSELRATVVTHSPTIAVALVEHPGVEVIVIGGRLFKHSIVAVGAATVEALAHIRADVYFMGVTGVHLDAGLSTGDLEEAHVKRALLHSAADTIVLASAEKLNAASPFLVAPLTDVSGLIVERDTPAEATVSYEELGLTITRA